MAIKDPIELDVSQVNDLVNKILAEGKGLPLMNDLGRIMVADTALNFRAQRSPEGAPWKATKRGGQILSDSTDLKRSITYKVSGQNKTTVGTNLVYGPVHQFGISQLVNVKAHARQITQAFGKKLSSPVTQLVGAHTRFMQIAARPFLGFGPRSLKKIDKAVASWADELLD